MNNPLTPVRRNMALGVGRLGSLRVKPTISPLGKSSRCCSLSLWQRVRVGGIGVRFILGRWISQHQIPPLAAVFLLCCWPSPSQSSESPPPTPDPDQVWSFDITPYLWVAGYEGTFGLPTAPSGTPPVHSSDPFLTHLSAAAMLAAQVHYRDVGLLFDGAWVQLKTEGEAHAGGLFSGTEMKSDIAYGTLALSYRLPQLGNLKTDLFAGARTWYISNQIEFRPGIAPGFTSESSQTWSDPILGANLRYDLSKHWFATVLGDFGGFGVGSDITWSVFGGVGYRFTGWFSATLGYRYLHVDYDKDGFLMNANVQGFLLGLGFHF
jgi:hypothetical protein